MCVYMYSHEKVYTYQELNFKLIWRQHVCEWNEVVSVRANEFCRHVHVSFVSKHRIAHVAERAFASFLSSLLGTLHTCRDALKERLGANVSREHVAIVPQQSILIESIREHIEVRTGEHLSLERRILRVRAQLH